MKKKKEFCERCRKDVEAKIIERVFTDMLKGKAYEYTGREAVCPLCTGEIYSGEVNDYNLIQLNEEYERVNYDEGYKLSMLNDEKGFLSEKRLGNEKRLTDEEERTKTKLNTAINYLIVKCQDITPLALQKALYYIQGFYYAFMGTFLFEEDCEAWVHGPVYRDIYYRYQTYRYDVIENVVINERDLLTEEELSIIDNVINYYCCYSGKVLEKFTHLENPWLITRNELNEDIGSDRIIDKEEISLYFLMIKSKYNMSSPSDIGKYSSDLFRKLK